MTKTDTGFSPFCLKDPTDLFICLAIFDTGVLALECCFNSLMSAAVYGLRVAAFRLTTLYLPVLVEWN